jgi:histidine ammonia-lyase
MVLRANVLALGHSGIRAEVVERILDLLNRGIHPGGAGRGSVGASGDLAPLSHIALALMGEGDVRGGGENGRTPRPRSGRPGWSRSGCRRRRGWR